MMKKMIGAFNDLDDEKEDGAECVDALTAFNSAKKKLNVMKTNCDRDYQADGNGPRGISRNRQSSSSRSSRYRGSQFFQRMQLKKEEQCLQ